MTEIKELLETIKAVKKLKAIAAEHEKSIAAIRDEIRAIQAELRDNGPIREIDA